MKSPDQVKQPGQARLDKTPLAGQLHDPSASSLQRYQAKVLGQRGLGLLMRYEATTLLCMNLSGALGYALRKILFRGLFKTAGAGLILGKGLALRHPKRISLGQRVAVDDYVLLDASGAGDEGISLGDDVIISRNCVVQGKSGPVRIGNRSDLGCNTVLSSISGIDVGSSVLIAANCYLGGGQYDTRTMDRPMMDQGLVAKGPVIIGDDVWLGAGVIVLDGVHIGAGSVVGAGAVVTRDLPERAVAVGVPAKIISMRGD
ncbi:MAG TPA: acyltransferase [Desulfonatronum sp.]|nr:acyltransferase [Desulfonatronum sp.]